MNRLSRATLLLWMLVHERDWEYTYAVFKVAQDFALKPQELERVVEKYRSMAVTA